MKKLITILSLIMFKGCLAFGQIKIGEISLDSITATKYFADCYLHPDTLSLIRMWQDKGQNSFSFTYDEESLEKARVKTFNDLILLNSIYRIIDTIRISAYDDTVYNSERVYYLGGTGSKIFYDSLNQTQHLKEVKSGIKQINHYNDTAYYNPSNKYAVPRKPSEQDFIKWYNKQK